MEQSCDSQFSLLVQITSLSLLTQANTPVPDLPSLFTAPAPVRPFSLPSFSVHAPTCLHCQTQKCHGGFNMPKSHSLDWELTRGYFTGLWVGGSGLS